jgi:hypothetical protein
MSYLHGRRKRDGLSCLIPEAKVAIVYLDHAEGWLFRDDRGDLYRLVKGLRQAALTDVDTGIAEIDVVKSTDVRAIT